MLYYVQEKSCHHPSGSLSTTQLKAVDIQTASTKIYIAFFQASNASLLEFSTGTGEPCLAALLHAALFMMALQGLSLCWTTKQNSPAVISANKHPANVPQGQQQEL